MSFLLAIALLLEANVAVAGCPADSWQLRNDIRQAQAAWYVWEWETFDEAMHEVRRDLDCMEDLPPSRLLAEVYELEARAALREKDLDRAARAFVAVLRIDPGFARDPSEYGNQWLAEEALNRARSGMHLETWRCHATGNWFLDGNPDHFERVPRESPFYLQRLTSDGEVRSWYVRGDGTLPIELEHHCAPKHHVRLPSHVPPTSSVVESLANTTRWQASRDWQEISRLRPGSRRHTKKTQEFLQRYETATISAGGVTRHVDIPEVEQALRVLYPHEPTPSQEPPARYPTITGPNEVHVEQPFVLSVALTEARLDDAPVTVPHGKQDDEGRLVLDLPRAEEWQIDIVLLPGDFTSVDGAATVEQEITLPATGDSTWAHFDLVLSHAPSGEEASLSVLFYDGTRLLAQVGRSFPVATALAPTHSMPGVAATAIVQEAPTQPRRPAKSSNEFAQSAAPIATGLPRPTLSILVHDHQDETALVRTVLDLPGADRIAATNERARWVPAARGAFTHPYKHALARSSRSTQIGQTPKRSARALGKELWRSHLPDEVRVALEHLYESGSLDDCSIEIDTNDPSYPWELLVPPGSAALPLGAYCRVGRWHTAPGSAGTSVVTGRIPYEELAVLAPRHEGEKALTASLEEARALQELSVPATPIEAKRDHLTQLLTNAPKGVLHFAGHGEIIEDPPGSQLYALLLEDGPFTAPEWIDATTWKAATVRPLVFLNACDLGESSHVGGVVEGFGPAALGHGAGAFIGALWPIGDRSAAEFAEAFYQQVERRLETEGRAVIAEVLRDLRNSHVHTQNPTWAAYVLYGHPGAYLEPAKLRSDSPPSPPTKDDPDEPHNPVVP